MKYFAVFVFWWLGTWYQSGGSTTAFCLDPTRRSKPKRTFLSAANFGGGVCGGGDIMQDEADFDPQVQIALQAVRQACGITKELQEQIKDIGTITKTDASPVTVADFASQAIILHRLRHFFPDGIFLAEESSNALTPPVTQQILEACHGIFDTEEILKECIDLGQTFYAVDQPPSRFWCLDPIDGTKGFIRKEQYCVALGLLEHGTPTIGILACPNLPYDDNSPESTIGCIFVACKGKGCYQLPLEESFDGKKPKLLDNHNPLTQMDPSQARFSVGVEQGFSDPVGKCKAMAKFLHGRLAEDDEIVYSARMDSQAKYGAVARGEAEFYVRLPKSDHRDWIWDVAPGVVVIEEVGGIVTDKEGKPLDFSQGARLSSNGILGAKDSKLHEALLNAYRQT